MSKNVKMACVSFFCIFIICFFIVMLGGCSKNNTSYSVVNSDTLSGLDSSTVNVDGHTIPVYEGYMPFMGYKTYFRIAGVGNSEKAPLICIHGGPGGGHDTLEYLDRLSVETGRQIITYDQLGCGKSYVEGHTELWCLQTWTDELTSLREYLGLNKVHLLGQSWGGMLIISYLVDQPSDWVLSGIITSGHCSSSLWASEQHRLIKFMSKEHQEAIAKAEATGDFSSAEYIAANEEYVRLYCNDDPQSYPEECFRRGSAAGSNEVYNAAWGPNEYNPTGTLKDFEYRDKLSQIKQPCLIISGTNDCCTPLMAKTMKEGIPNSKWELLQGVRHRCYYEGGQHYREICNDFMEEHE